MLRPRIQAGASRFLVTTVWLQQAQGPGQRLQSVALQQLSWDLSSKLPDGRLFWPFLTVIYSALMSVPTSAACSAASAQ